jgi:SmpA / OmlA family
MRTMEIAAGAERTRAMRGMALALCLIAGGCGGASVELPIRGNPQVLLQKVERGTTTKDQVRALFGNTVKTEQMSDGYEQWTYEIGTSQPRGRYVPGAGYAPEQQQSTFVVIVFDSAGIVRDYTSSATTQ